MPYNPGINNIAGQLLAQGIGSLGDDAAQVIQKRRQLEEQNAATTMGYQTLANATDPNGNPILTDDEREKFLSGNQNVRNGIVVGGFQRLMQARQQMEDQSRQAEMQARLQTALASRKIAQAGSDVANTKIYDGQGNEVGIYDATGSPHFYPGGAAGGNDVNVLPLKDPGSGKIVPNRGIIDKTGQVVDTSTDAPTGVTVDPTGKYYLDNKTKSWKPIPATTMFAPTQPQQPAAQGQQQGAQQSGNQPPVPVQTPQDAMALPPGTRYQTPDGKIFIR